MKKLNNAFVATLVFVLLVCAVCASNPHVGGEVVSGILMGIGTGLSGL